MIEDNKSNKIKVITILISIIYLVYFCFIVFWIHLFHFSVNIFTLIAIILPCILFVLLNYGVIRTSQIINKRYIIFMIILTLVPVLISFGKVSINEYESKFICERWIEKEDKRVWMVDDLLIQYEIESMSKEEIIELLGEPTNTAYFKEVNNIVYWLGAERSLVSIDSEWLVIWFNDENKVERYEIMRD